MERAATMTSRIFAISLLRISSGMYQSVAPTMHVPTATIPTTAKVAFGRRLREFGSFQIM